MKKIETDQILAATLIWYIKGKVYNQCEYAPQLLIDTSQADRDQDIISWGYLIEILHAVAI